MCGICGIYHLGPDRPAGADVVRRMADRITHRGPDADGYSVTGRAALGHRRLRIVDLEGGVQPMASDDGRVVLVYNGEVFNFPELRRELEARGHRFRTRSDTEVLLRLYEDRGETMVEDLRGQFAFAIHDSRSERLFLARDRIGIKPLFWTVEGDRFLFASEIKSILGELGATPDLDPTAVVDYFTYLYVPAPKTVYRAVRALEPGHTMTVTPDGTTRRRYWHLDFEPDRSLGRDDAEAEIVESLRESVRLRLVSDVPIGAFLSGGIDSSAVAAAMADVAEEPIRTFSVGFREAAFDELPYARAMAERIGSRHREEVVPVEPATVFRTLVDVFDEPFGDSSAMPTWTVSRITRESVTVCLSGDGGDENFAGYRRYRFDLLENRLRRLLPRPVRRGVLGPLASAWPKADWLPQRLRAKTLLGNLAADADRGYFHTQSALPRTAIDRVLAPDLRREVASYDAFDAMRRHFDEAPADPLSRIQYVDFMTYLPGDILTKVDRTSMACSLEVRVPLLDHVFVERAARMPSGWKLEGGEGKAVFKRALRGLVPDATLERPKQGFAVPLSQWMRGELAAELDSVVEDAGLDGVLDRDALRSMVGKHRSRVRDFGWPLYSVLAFGAWHRRWIRGDRSGAVEAPPPPPPGIGSRRS